MAEDEGESQALVYRHAKLDIKPGGKHAGLFPRCKDPSGTRKGFT